MRSLSVIKANSEKMAQRYAQRQTHQDLQVATYNVGLNSLHQ